jgi:hypothetical protein
MRQPLGTCCIEGTAPLIGCCLTEKLRGRPTTPDRRRGRTLLSRARGANQTTPHGPLQRLLGGIEPRVLRPSSTTFAKSKVPAAASTQIVTFIIDEWWAIDARV